MASVSRLNGFRPVKFNTGAPYTGAASVYFVPASNADVIMVGDVVKLAGDGRSPTGYPLWHDMLVVLRKLPSV